MTSGADALIIDLEDSIALHGKARARESAAAFLRVGFESHEARAIRRTSSMTDAA
jgi:citrate lyase beta subunit